MASLLTKIPGYVARREAEGFLKAGLIEDADIPMCTVMLLAAKVEFDRARTIKESKQPAEFVNTIYDRMEQNGLWIGGRWLFEECPDGDEEAYMQVQFVMHFLVARGEFVRASGGFDGDEAKA